jgi:hypothetical protein
VSNPLLISAVVAASLFVGNAFAADLAVVDEPVAVPAAGFDWEGGFIGVFAGGTELVHSGNTYGQVGVRAGYNFLLSESILAGIEGDAVYLDGTNGVFKQALVSARLGFLATDSLWLYGRGGVGLEYNSYGDSTSVYGVGIGAELAVTDQLSLTADINGGNYFDGDGDFIESVSANFGLNFHF